MTDKFYTPRQVSEMLQYSREYIYRLLNKTVNDGGIPSVKVGNSRRIGESDLNKWIDRQFSCNERSLKVITKKKLIRFLNHTCMYCLMAMSAGMVVGCFLLMFNVFWNLV